MSEEIYFDNSATTRVHPEVAELVMQVMLADYGNPSSLHRKGLAAEQILKRARRQVATVLSVGEDDLIFTSGGTESDNLAIIGAAHAYKKQGRHLITTAIEHPAVLNACKLLTDEGFELDILPVDSHGLVDPAAVEAALRPDTILVSIMQVNNEVGSVQPIEQISRLLRARERRILLHVDAVQGFGKLFIKPTLMGIDLLSASGHKIHAPKGVGFLYKAKSVRLLPLLGGGGQEQNLRSGTENLPGIAGLGLAAEQAFRSQADDIVRVRAVRAAFLAGLGGLSDWQVHGAPEAAALPHILNIGFAGVKSEVLLHSLEAVGLYVSSGSACAAKKDTLSPTLTAMGLERAEIEGTLRFSFSADNTVEEAVRAAELVVAAVTELRRILK